MTHSIPERPVNLYRRRGDLEVWEQAERNAKAAGMSLSAYVVAALRKYQEAEVR